MITIMSLLKLRNYTCADPKVAPCPDHSTPEKSQSYRVRSNTGPDPVKNHKATESAFNVSPAKRHLNGPWLAGR